jgi:hypothetical protein
MPSMGQGRLPRVRIQLFRRPWLSLLRPYEWSGTDEWCRSVPGVRRIWLTVLVGLFGLVLGLIIGFAVGLREKLGDSGWLEAVGTWVGAGVTLLAVILAGIVFFSEEYARRREHRRQTDATEGAKRAKSSSYN